MKKILSVSSFILLLLVGCQDTKNRTLDTSNLKKVEMDDVAAEPKKKILITYEAPSVKAGLEALPFNMKLPEKLPFEATPFQPPTINDMSRDGKKLMVEFKAFSKNKDDQTTLMITTFSEEVEIDITNFEQVRLKDGVVAGYSNNVLQFNKGGVSYVITYMNKNISDEQHKQEITDIANQMF